jgi:hypothetical protein
LRCQLRHQLKTVIVGGGSPQVQSRIATKQYINFSSVFIGRTSRACSSNQRYGPQGCSEMWTGDVQVGARVVARNVPWAGSIASGRPTLVTAAGGMTQLRGVPAVWAVGFTYAYPRGYTGDGVVTSGDGLGLAIALWVGGGLLLIGAIGWGAGVLRR